MRNIFHYSLLLLFFAICGCNHKVILKPDLEISEPMASRLNLNIGLYIPQELKNLEISNQTEDNERYIFVAGDSIASMIQKACTNTFSSVEILEAYPTEAIGLEKNIDLFLLVKITDANVGLSFQKQFFHTDAEGICHINISMEFLEKNLNHFTAIAATGTGMEARSIGAFSTGKEEFAFSVKTAIQNLGNNIVRQINENYNIRKRAE